MWCHSLSCSTLTFKSVLKVWGFIINHHMETQLIRRAEPGDAKIISEIYNAYILNSTVTFETKAIDEVEMRRRILEKLATHDWLVAEVSGQIVGYGILWRLSTQARLCPDRRINHLFIGRKCRERARYAALLHLDSLGR